FENPSLQLDYRPRLFIALPFRHFLPCGPVAPASGGVVEMPSGLVPALASGTPPVAVLTFKVAEPPLRAVAVAARRDKGVCDWSRPSGPILNNPEFGTI